jgi:hypothetical protein
MMSLGITRRALLPALVAALIGLTLTLPLASRAASRKPATAGVSTGGVGHVSGTSAELEGTIVPHGVLTTYTYYFEYGPSVSYGKDTTSATTAVTSENTTSVKVSQTAIGFLPKYDYRLVVEYAGTEGAVKKPGLNREYIAKTKVESKPVIKKDAFELPKSYEATLFGGTFTLAGTLTGSNSAKREVVLQANPYPYAAQFADVGAPVLTSADGGFVLRAPKLRASTKFRVATVATAGSPAVLSLVANEQVTALVSLKVRFTSRKGLVRLYGTVTPAAVGAHVVFQLERPPRPAKTEMPGKLERPGAIEKAEERAELPTFALTRLSTIVKRATRTISRFSAVVNVTTEGSYRALVELPAGPVASGHSPTVKLYAAKKKSRKSAK